MSNDEGMTIKATSPRWIGWKARPLLRIRYGSEDDGCVIVEGADIRPQRRSFSQRVEDNLCVSYARQ
jgi:hypothetical protein